MRNKFLFRIWLSKIMRYLLIPTALCVILIPLYDIFRQQTVRAQLSDASEQLASSASVLDGYLYDIRYVTNKLFHDTSFATLAASTDDSVLEGSTIGQTATRLLEDLTYSMTPVAYSYVTFDRNQIVVDTSRVYRSYDSFYPGTLEYSGLSRENWAWQLRQTGLYCMPCQKVPLYQTSYPNSFLSISQPYFDAYDRYMGTCTMLLREKQLIQLFIPQEQWQRECLFYIARQDGTMLLRYGYDGEAPLEDIPASGSAKFNGQEYLFVTRGLPDLDATVVLGLPYSVYAENLNTINRVIRGYIAAGIVVSLVLSVVMTLTDMRYLKPMMDILETHEEFGGRKYYQSILQKQRSYSQLTIELEQLRSQMEHGRVDALLKTGRANSPGERALLLDTLHLTKWNYLLLIPPVSQEVQGNEEYRLMLLVEQVYQCFGGEPFVHNTTDGGVLVILPVTSNTDEAYDHLCRCSTQLHDQLQTQQSLVLSGCFTELEQLSAAYWQVRNAAARPSSGEGVIFLNRVAAAHTTMPEIATLERLNEYLLAGHTEEAQDLVVQIFGSSDLPLLFFRQIFFSVRGVLLAVAEQLGCEDISQLCAYDQSKSMRRQIQDLCDGCLVICNHVDELKQSHNQRLQTSILQWLGENYRLPELNLAMIAEQFHISKKYVSQFLKDQTGKSYNEYVEELRLTHAMELLRQSSLSMTEISVQCGFASQNTFYKAFRRRFDISPSSVRRDALQSRS